MMSADAKPCPMCGETIKAVARKCRFCGEILTRGDRPGDDVSLQVWREGRLLVMNKKAQLPVICVRTNEPAAICVRRRMFWHHPLVYLGLLGGLCPYVLVALILQQKADIQVPLCQGCCAWRARLRMAEWLAGLGALALAVLGIATARLARAALLLLPLGLLILIAIAVVETFVTSVVRPKRITREFVWLAGAHPDYLASLPEFPGEHAV